MLGTSAFSAQTEFSVGTAADEAGLGVNPMKSSNHRVGHRVGNLASRTTTYLQMVESSEDKDGGRYRIRTYDFHRVNLSVLELGFTTTYETAGTAEVRGSRVSYQILWAGLWVGS
jgi:hypothetical protein